MEISFSAPEILDDSEDELEDEGAFTSDADTFDASKTVAMMNASFAQRSPTESRGRATNEKRPEAKAEEPQHELGVVDFVVVVGCNNIGNQRRDDGTKGWVESSPESVIIEQIPPNNEFRTGADSRSLQHEGRYFRPCQGTFAISSQQGLASLGRTRV